MEEVSADAVVSLDLSRRALPSLAPWLSPPFPGCAPPLEHLEALDASRNALCGARGLEHLPRLRSLNLYFNRIEQLAELLRLRPAAGTLQALDLRLNPVARLEGYRRCVCAAPVALRQPPLPSPNALACFAPNAQVCGGAAARAGAAGREARDR